MKLCECLSICLRSIVKILLLPSLTLTALSCFYYSWAILCLSHHQTHTVNNLLNQHPPSSSFFPPPIWDDGSWNSNFSVPDISLLEFYFFIFILKNYLKKNWRYNSGTIYLSFFFFSFIWWVLRSIYTVHHIE